MNGNEQLTLWGDESRVHSFMVNVNEMKQHLLALWLNKRRPVYDLSVSFPTWACPPLPSSSAGICYNQGDPLHFAYVDTCRLRPRDLACAKTQCLFPPSRKYNGNNTILSQTIDAPRGGAVGGMAHAEMKLRVIELRIWEAVTWCGGRMQYHVYSHFLCGVPSW